MAFDETLPDYSRNQITTNNTPIGTLIYMLIGLIKVILLPGSLLPGGLANCFSRIIVAAISHHLSFSLRLCTFTEPYNASPKERDCIPAHQ